MCWRSVFFVLTPQINNQCGLSVHCQEQEAAKLWPRERWARKGGPGSRTQGFWLNPLLCSTQAKGQGETNAEKWLEGWKKERENKKGNGIFFSLFCLTLLPFPLFPPSLLSLYMYIFVKMWFNLKLSKSSIEGKQRSSFIPISFPSIALALSPSLSPTVTENIFGLLYGEGEKSTVVLCCLSSPLSQWQIASLWVFVFWTV